MISYDLAAAIVRAWARCYTLGLPAAEREDRIGEIESDIWESRGDHDADGWTGSGLSLLWRLWSGAWDDVAWRVEQVRARSLGRIGLAVAVVLAMVCASPQSRRPATLTLSEPQPAFVALAPVVPMAAPLAATTAHSTMTTSRASVQVGARPNSRPDVVGTWTLDLTRSDSPTLPVWDPRRTVGQSGTLQLTRSDERLTQTSWGESGSEVVATFDLRGGVLADPGGRFVRRATWAGRRLVLVTTRIEKGGAWSTTDVLDVTADGDTLVVERVNQAGELWSTYVGRVPDAARARVRDVFVRADGQARLGANEF